MTPCAVSHSSFDGPTMPMTVAPVRFASCTAIEPTPPVAPATATASSGVSPTEPTAAYAVVPATKRPPATSHGTVAGLAVELLGGHYDEFGLTRALVGEPDHLVADREVVDVRADLGHHTGQVAALP